MSNTESADKPQVIRVGLLGASSIAHKTWAAIKAAGGLQITAVGSRTADKSKQFIDDCAQDLDVPEDQRPVGMTYEELVASPDVDVIYISIPVTKRSEWMAKCAENGKHVVGEKPPAKSADELRSWLEAFKPKKLLYMDGTMFSHGAYVAKVVENLPKVGRIRRIATTLCWLGTPEQEANDIRYKPDLEPIGALGDCGWYCVRTILHVMKFAMPTAVSGRIISSTEDGAITAFSGELTFHDEETGEVVTAYFYTSFTCAMEANLIVSGNEGTLQANNLTNPLTDNGPATFQINVGSLAFKDGDMLAGRKEETVEVPEETGHQQETQLWRDVRDCLQRQSDGTLVANEADAQHWAKLSWMTQCILDSLVKSAHNRRNVQGSAN